MGRIFALVICFGFGTRGAAAEPLPHFVIFDGLLQADRPDLRVHGLVPITWVGDLWQHGVSMDRVDDARIRSIFEHVSDRNGYFYLDIENWPLQGVSLDARQQNIGKLTQVLELARRYAPNAHLGFYGLMPGITYWPLFRRDREYQEWLAVNQSLDPLAQKVDGIFPSLYTYYDDLDGWTKAARLTVAEARRYGKPVYVFLWPEFHDGNPDLRGHQLPRAFWRAELDLSAELADGIVLWGGWKEHWNENASWWQETLAFMGTIDSHRHSGRQPSK